MVLELDLGSPGAQSSASNVSVNGDKTPGNFSLVVIVRYTQIDFANTLLQ